MRFSFLAAGTLIVVCLSYLLAPSSRRLSVVSQALTYFTRPHSGIPTSQLAGPHVWRGADLNTSAWRTELTQAQLTDIAAGVARTRALGFPLERLTRTDCYFPELTLQLAAWRNATLPGEGLGFAVISGLRVEGWDAADRETFFWCLGLHLGRPGAQNSGGDLLGHVRDEFLGGTPRAHAVRQYRTNEAITWHCDTADVVALYCVSEGAVGGSSRLVSSSAVYNSIARTRPDLAALMFEPVLVDSRGDGGVSHFAVRPSRFFGGILRTFFHAEYLLTAYDHKDAPAGGPPQRVRELVAAVKTAADAPGQALAMDFRRGDIQIVSNHLIMHSRAAFEDDPREGGARRHLLRLWLSYDEPSWGSASFMEGIQARLSASTSLAELVVGLAVGKLRSLVLA